MTIGYVLDDTLDKADGVQQATIAIAEKMRTLGHDVHYIVTETKRTDLKNVHVMSRYISLKFNGNSVRTPWPASRKQITKLFLDIQFDILHVQLPYSPFMAARVVQAAPSNVVVVGTFHILPYGRLAPYATALLGKVLSGTLRRFDAFTAVSEPALFFMKQSFSVEGIVIPNPVNVAYYRSFTAASNTTKDRNVNIVFIGRFEKRKGVVELVDAIAALPAPLLRNVKVIMCGQGPYRDVLVKRSLGASLPITFPGFVTEQEKARYLSSADIAVFPSTGGESFGIVLAEAMAAGAGVTLGGDNPGYRSVLSAWSDTVLDTLNPTLFAKQLERFITDKKLRQSIGEQQQKAVSKYDIQLVCERFEQLYEQLKSNE